MLIMLLFGLYSCALAPLKNLEKQTLQQDVQMNTPLIFNNASQVNYRCKILAFDQLLTGVMVFKKVEQGIRVVMLTDFGLKVIDIRMNKDDTYQVNYIMKHMDYAFVRESFAKNLRMLMDNKVAAYTYEYQDGDNHLFYDKHLLYYQKDNRTFKIERYRGKNKLIAIAEIQKNANIDILQLNPKMSINLSLITNAKR